MESLLDNTIVTGMGFLTTAILILFVACAFLYGSLVKLRRLIGNDRRRVDELTKRVVALETEQKMAQQGRINLSQSLAYIENKLGINSAEANAP